MTYYTHAIPTAKHVPAPYAGDATALVDNWSNLPASKREFACSLIEQAANKGSLSEKQAYWLGKLASMAGKPAKPAPTGIDTGGDLTAIMQLFETASTHLKRPKVVLELGDGRKVHLTPAKPNSNNPGHLYVKLAGDYAGKVAPDGTFLPFKLTDADADALADLLFIFAQNPAAHAKMHGQKTGNCCFCNTEITTKESLHAGYGPICAEHFGLPWGETE